MTSNSPNGSAAAELRCANCHHRLDPTDKFCRECGLPTVHRAHTQRAVPTPPPDTAEFRRAMDVAADPRPFVREASDESPAGPADAPELTTGSVVRVTNPTQAAQMAASTLVMVGLIVVLVVVGVVLLVLAFQQSG